MKLFLHRDSREKARESLLISPGELREDIRRTKIALDNALDNFNHVTDPVLIDYYSYTIKAVGIRYQFLLKQAKHLDLASSN